jgi:hypothetical protein
MPFLPDELKISTFPCPGCKQIISSEIDSCRYCSIQITSEIKEIEVKKESEVKKQINLNRHKNYLILGLVLLGLGVLSIVSPIIELKYSSGVNFTCLTPIFIISGIGITVKSLIDYKREKNH